MDLTISGSPKTVPEESKIATQESHLKWASLNSGLFFQNECGIMKHIKIGHDYTGYPAFSTRRAKNGHLKYLPSDSLKFMIFV